ncbi:dTDP-4-amino-4,6-dideoxygalactose transaminase [Chitinophaga alhagiae]|uniref:dTDP-4-amino-4,6-dideoxygalactose transaminase n=1 Tax=Chitinophaga alhagiae TaxID=2203219 RepID=A0ABM6WE04_9BACT|nr:dTDP-4-amino-4,6-dideoxygalactose transaminase [Chitinophaga alhagiae]AWO02239.1 dTDP-4-amino-4,6-dideoxygalactose transaminase [Chitinophaga alhagiae]
MIPFNVPLITGKEKPLLDEVLSLKKLCGDGSFTKKCHAWLENFYQAPKALLTTSCTHALEISALLAGIEAGDEVIMPSFTFVSTANAFALRGAKIVFVDVDPATMNMNAEKIESAITPRTKAIVPVHYAGVSCDMDSIMGIAAKHGLLVIEDAAQALQSFYKGKPVGKFGHLSCISFHETKNVHCGEGGALVINEELFAERAEIIREKGTNRSRFLRGQIDKYTWVDIGSSYLPSELNAAFLYAQLEESASITQKRLAIWNSYYSKLSLLEKEGLINFASIPAEVKHNAHMFYIKLKNIEQRQALISFLKENGVQGTFHYVPLHSSQAGLQFGRFQGVDEYTTTESERLLRLPMHLNLDEAAVEKVCAEVTRFFKP